MSGAPRRADDSDTFDRWLVPPRWLLERRAGTFHVLDLRDGASLELRGAIAGALPHATTPDVRSLAALEPRLAALLTDLEQQGAHRLDRAAILRGSGYRQLFVELTNKCNERCVHCYSDSGPRQRVELEIDVVRSILADGRQLGFTHVQLTGGDPLLASTFEAAARCAVELAYPSVEVYTNGLALDSRFLARLEGLPLSWAFSLYSHDPGRHDAVTTTPGSHRRTSAAIGRALRTGRPVRVGIVLTNVNRADLTSTISYLRDLGVRDDAMGVDVAREVGRGTFLDAKIERPLRNTGASVGGAAFVGRAAVAYDGRIHPCIFSREIVLGDVRDPGGLYAALTRPDPVCADPGVFERAASWGRKLTCASCRLRASLLSAPRLAVLG